MDYEYVDTSGFDTSIGIYPLRRSTAKDMLCGNDICFIWEAIQQRLNFLLQVKLQTDAGVWQTYTISQSGLVSPPSNMSAEDASMIGIICSAAPQTL